MKVLAQKAREVAQTLLPVVVFVLLLCLTIVDVETDILLRFVVASVLLLAGLAVFLWGVEISMNPIGEHMSREIVTSKQWWKIAGLSFLLGSLVTVAEPDLLILGSQIQAASGHTVRASLIVYMVAIGVGGMIALGVFRLLREGRLNVFMTVTYAVILALALAVSPEFLAISFDASGATTGALATPFILALSLGLSSVRGGRHAQENSFGLVGVMSAGPILAVMLMSILSGQRNIQGEAAAFAPARGVLAPIIRIVPTMVLESLLALAPITVVFLVSNFGKFKLPTRELLVIAKGLVLTLVGLVCFLTAANAGFMDIGRIIGMEIAATSKWLLIGTGFVLGLIAVLVEPAVHVLSEQIGRVSAGRIPLHLVRMTLSAGVAAAIALSMVRILIPHVQLWHFLLPGFGLAALLSFFVDPVFVGIAYDAGGVASGPIAATLVLAFAQGAASVVDTANVLVDGFGVIAMVATAPVLAIMILGAVYGRIRPKGRTDTEVPAGRPESRGA